VLWLGLPEVNATWEPACSLPQSLVDDYEAGISREAEVHTTTTYGHSYTTVMISKKKDDPQPKKRKGQRPSRADLEG
jgi:hypothetical protein